MSETEKTAVAAHLYVSMRRIANRVIDIEWMSKNEEYALAIIQLARQQGVEELTKYADRYEELMTGKTLSSPPPPVQAKPEVSVRERAPEATEPTPEQEAGEDDSTHEISPDRYIGSLR